MGNGRLPVTRDNERGLMSEPVTKRMAELVRQWQQHSDDRAIFLRCYQMMTENMIAGVANGRFHNGPWVTHLLEHFANYYFNALDAYEHGQPCAQVWRIAHNVAINRRAHVLQNLFLGVNAHINYDLALVIYDLLHAEWGNLSSAQRQAHYEDYCLVNDIIAETLDAVQDQVVERHSPLMALVDWLGGRMDEFIVTQLITHWREEVWHTARQLVEAADDKAWEQVRQKLEKTALQRSRVILWGRDNTHNQDA